MRESSPVGRPLALRAWKTGRAVLFVIRSQLDRGRQSSFKPAASTSSAAERCARLKPEAEVLLR